MMAAADIIHRVEPNAIPLQLDRHTGLPAKTTEAQQTLPEDAETPPFGQKPWELYP